MTEKYLDKILETLEIFKKTMEKHFGTGILREFKQMIEENPS